jgi:hypothetical protein
MFPAAIIMDKRPKCVIITGRPGSGKNTLAVKLARALWMPLISRDEIKEGYVNTFGVRHDELPPDANARATDIFFDIVRRHLSQKVSIVIEAAFQHHVWQLWMPMIVELSFPIIVRCRIDDSIAARRYLERGLADPEREYYHGDNMVVHFRKTGERLSPAAFDPPHFDLPEIAVSTEGEYRPSIEEVVSRLRAISPG